MTDSLWQRDEERFAITNDRHAREEYEQMLAALKSGMETPKRAMRYFAHWQGRSVLYNELKHIIEEA